jgi:predicted alpha/beta-hydrolase family hydrolase
MPKIEALRRTYDPGPDVRGHVHYPDGPARDALVFTHGASGNGGSRLLVALAEEFARAGLLVLRCDLPYRQRRPGGPPSPGGAAQDRAGLRQAVECVRDLVKGRVFLGGQSYGGRQATMLAAEEPELVSGLVLTSYPLHPPGKPERPRTEHFARLRTPSLFVHGSDDPFGTLEEMKEALQQIAGPHWLLEIEGGIHGLVRPKAPGKVWDGVMAQIREAFEGHLR